MFPMPHADTMLNAMLEMHSDEPHTVVVAPPRLSPAPSGRHQDLSLPQASQDARLGTSLPVAGAKALSAEALQAASALLAATPSHDRGSKKLLNEETLDFMQEVKVGKGRKCCMQHMCQHAPRMPTG